MLLLTTPVVIALAGALLDSPLGPVGLMVLGAFVVLVLVKVSADDEPAEDPHAQERHVFEQARWYGGRYLLPEDYDERALALLRRTQEAIGSVLRSHINAEGLLDDARNAILLPAQEWEIATLLAKLSRLRSEHHDLMARGVAPEVEAVVEPLERALKTSESAVAARVEALERYAGHVAEAERAYHARSQIEDLRALLPRYEDLLAEAGADRLALTEIDRLAEDADHLEQALRRSVRSAHEAFGYLES
jgi:hypothetical protein